MRGRAYVEARSTYPRTLPRARGGVILGHQMLFVFEPRRMPNAKIEFLLHRC